MQTEILFFEVSAFKTTDLTSFSFKTSEHLKSVDKDTISEWQPLDRSEIIMTATYNIGIKGKHKNKEYPNFYITIVSSKMVRLFKDKRRLFIIPYYESWEQLKQELETILVTNKYSSYEEFVRGISKYFEYEYEYAFDKQDKRNIGK